MKKYCILNFLFIALYIVIAQPLWANDLNTQTTQVTGPYTVHYSVFNSMFIQPDIAALYSLTRGKDKALINITVQDTKTGKALAVNISGTAKNLIQQYKTLAFKEISETNAIYYIADLRTSEQEVFHFTIDFNEPQKTKHTVKFSRKLYIEQ